MIATRLGGLFYLLNLAVYVGIYHDFTQVANPGWELSPWDYLALLGRYWLGAALQADPLWFLLARLANRPEDEEPGAGFLPPPGWQDELLANLSLEDGENWLGTLAAALEKRLRQALGDDQPLRFLYQPAQIWLSSTRLDIHYALASHPVALRMAGLDRDLGWLPAAGMYLYYHYDD